MPVAKIHVLEGQYNEARLDKVSGAIQEALINALGIPPEDFFQLVHVLPRSQFRHNIIAAVGISPDDLVITLYETHGENISFGRGLAQRADISALKSTHVESAPL